MSIQLFSTKKRSAVDAESGQRPLVAEPLASAAKKVNPPLSPANKYPSDDPLTASCDFTSLGLQDWIVDALRNLAIAAPTNVQMACVPEILKGRDVVASAKTGSGKTAAFALPILQRLASDPYGTYAVVLTPTRELAFQIAEQVKAFGQNIRVSVSVVVGGVDMMKQAKELSGQPHFIVATPGRLADLMTSSRDCLHLRRLRYLVLDEADRMLESTFTKDLGAVFDFIEAASVKRPQLLLFSATLTRELSTLLSDSPAPSPAVDSSSERPSKVLKVPLFRLPAFLRLVDPFVHHSSEDFGTVHDLIQRYLLVPSQVKEVYLVYLLKNQFKDIKSLIVFTGKCTTAELLRLMFRELDLRSTSLHSKMSQKERLASIAKFKANVVPILITTDVGSRGLDIPTVQLVINYDVPAGPRDYIHRIGRTARAGRGGLALTMMGEIDIDLILAIEDKIGKKLENFDQVSAEDPKPLLREKDVLDLLTKVSTAKRVATMKLSESNYTSKQSTYKDKVARSIIN